MKKSLLILVLVGATYHAQSQEKPSLSKGSKVVQENSENNAVITEESPQVITLSQENAKLAKSSHFESSDSIKGRPADFPKFVDTGNPVEDEKNYRLAKEKYMSDHFGTEKSKNGQDKSNQNESVRDRNSAQSQKNIDNQGRKVISKEEFESYPQEKKDRILAEPSKFVIQ